MATLTLVAHPATTDGHFVSIEVTRVTARERVEVKTAADCATAFEAFAAKHAAGGVNVSGHIFYDRKPRGFSALKLNRFIEPKRVAV